MNLESRNCRSKKPISNCYSKKNNGENNILATLVTEYLTEYEDCYKNEDRWWGDKNITWTEAIERAWRSRFENGKMHGHQCRVAGKLHLGMEACLNRNYQVIDFDSFHAVYSWVESVTRPINGLGATTTYDVARRLGAWLGMQPEMVYLHAGAAEGAKNLGIEGEMVSLNDFPDEIQNLRATHAETFLCIYKHFLQRSPTTKIDSK